MASYDRRQDLRRAIQFALQNLRYWKLDAGVQAYYDAWLGRLDHAFEPCDHLPAPGENEVQQGTPQQIRYRSFLHKELGRHVREGRLAAHLVAPLRTENQRIAKELASELRRSTEGHEEESFGKDRLDEDHEPAETSEHPCSQSGETSTTIAGRLLEAILDPRSLQYLMMLGSALLVLGLVIWLATQGFFDNPLVIAVGAAVGNLLALGAGAYLLRRTRFETAGRGLTLLACLVMPLHLWFYDAQGLIVLNEGGHLWIPALAIAVLYAICAVLIRDSLFAYAMIGGVTLTGLMILGDQSIGRFWEGAAVSSLLITIAAVAIHSERAFLPGDGPFSRENFGRAFYRAGHSVLLGGLVVLLGWTASAWAYGGPLSDAWTLWRLGPLPFDEPALATSDKLRMLALGLSLASTYLYGYSYWMVTRRLIWIWGGIATFLWAEMILIDALPVAVTNELVMVVLAMTAVFFQGIAWGVRRLEKTSGREASTGEFSATMDIMACLCLFISLAMGIAGYLRASYQVFPNYEPTPLFGLAAVITTAACWLGVGLTRERPAYVSGAYAVGSCIAALLMLFSGLALLKWQAWDLAGPLLMVVPLTYLIVSRRCNDSTRTSLQIAAQCGAVLLTVAVLISAYGTSIRVVEPLTGAASELLLAVFLLEVCLFYAIHTAVTKQAAGSYLALLAGSGAVVQCEHYFHASPEVGLFSFGVVGLVLILVDRLFDVAYEDNERDNLAVGIGGQVVLSLAGTGSALLAFNRLWMVGFHGGALTLLLGMIAISLLAAVIVVPRAATRWYVSLAVIQGCSAFVLVAFGLSLEPWQKMEILLSAMGAVILVASHVGWAREGERQEDWVSLGLMVGSLLLAIPMVIGLVGQRLEFYHEATHWRMVHDIGALTAGLSLLGTGILLRLRTTTIVGSLAMLLYVSTLVVYVRLPEQLQGVAVYMMVGGGIFFVVSMLLSIFRDYLLALPDRFRHRKGLFRVLTWR